MSISTEIAIYILAAAILSSILRVIGGMKNACFYAKGKSPVPKLLAKYIYNLHYLETPAWYCQFGLQFLFSLALYRLFHIYSFDNGYYISCFAAYLTAMGSSSIAGVFYQGYINVASGKEFVDNSENPKSEFAFGPIKFWWPRPWYGKRRIYASLLGAIILLCGIYIGIYLD